MSWKAILKESTQLCCVSQDFFPRTSFPREPGQLGSAGTDHMRRPRTKKDAPAKQRGKTFTSSRIRTKLRFIFLVKLKGMPTPTASQRPEEREFVVDSGASMHLVSKKRIKLRRDGHCSKVQNTNSGVDCKR